MTTSAPPEGRDARPLCGANKRQGSGTCTQPAGWGTDHVGMGACKLHGGNTRSHRQHGQRTRLAGEVGRLLERHQIVGRSQQEGLQEVVDRTGAMVAVLGSLVGGLRIPGGEADDDDEPAEREQGDVAGDGFYGPDHLGDGRMHVLLPTYREWLAEHRQACKAAIDCGLDERRVRAAESQAVMLAPALRLVFADLAGTLVHLGELGQLDPPRVRRVFEVDLPEIVQRRVAELQRPAAIEAAAS